MLLLLTAVHRRSASHSREMQLVLDLCLSHPSHLCEIWRVPDSLGKQEEGELEEWGGEGLLRSSLTFSALDDSR